MKPSPPQSFYLLWISAAASLLPAVFHPPSWPLWVTLNLLLVGTIVFGTLSPTSVLFGPVITGFHTSRKEVWLTLDDGPDPYYTQKTLELLARYQVTATFFLIGTRTQAHPELADAIVQRGHNLGNHSATHPSAYFWALPYSAAIRQIDGGTHAIRAATGCSPLWFRAPVGMANCFVRAALLKRGMLLIGFSCRGFDALPTSPDKVIQKIFRTIKPGAILLLHESSSQPPLRDNLLILEAVLIRLRAEGYACVTPHPQQFTIC